MNEQIAHIGAIATLLLAAYAFGWALGYVLRRTVSRRRAPAEQGTGQRISSPAADSAPAAVAASAPVAVTAAVPVEIAATIPEPVRAGPVPANAGLMAQPEPVSALETLKSLSTAIPLVPVAVAAAQSEETATEAGAPAAAAIATPGSIGDDVATTVETPAVVSEPESVSAPRVAPAPTEIVPATPAATPGVPWSGHLHGRKAELFVADVIAVGSGTSERQRAVPLQSVTDSWAKVATAGYSAQPGPEPVARAIEEAVGEDSRPGNSPDLVVSLPTGQPKSAAVLGDEFPSGPSFPQAEPSPPAAPVAEPHRPEAAPDLTDEDSAMRDIEGGWSRGGVRRAGNIKDVSAAVSAAQLAVEQVLARGNVDPDPAEAIGQAAFGRPRGLPRPRDGGRDDLKQIAGLGPMDESALNNLGIYHFDQIANLDEREVLWLENHAFARGRIGREEWQQQARQLGAETAALRVGR